jgi:hypothetical protein
MTNWTFCDKDDAANALLLLLSCLDCILVCFAVFNISRRDHFRVSPTDGGSTASSPPPFFIVHVVAFVGVGKWCISFFPCLSTKAFGSSTDRDDAFTRCGDGVGCIAPCGSLFTWLFKSTREQGMMPITRSAMRCRARRSSISVTMTASSFLIY